MLKLASSVAVGFLNSLLRHPYFQGTFDASADRRVRLEYVGPDGCPQVANARQSPHESRLIEHFNYIVGHYHPLACGSCVIVRERDRIVPIVSLLLCVLVHRV